MSKPGNRFFTGTTEAPSPPVTLFQLGQPQPPPPPVPLFQLGQPQPPFSFAPFATSEYQTPKPPADPNPHSQNSLLCPSLPTGWIRLKIIYRRPAPGSVRGDVVVAQSTIAIDSKSIESVSTDPETNTTILSLRKHGNKIEVAETADEVLLAMMKATQGTSTFAF
jgi:hypothetical protein